jgi:hypothetical protein
MALTWLVSSRYLITRASPRYPSQAELRARPVWRLAARQVTDRPRPILQTRSRHDVRPPMRFLLAALLPRRAAPIARPVQRQQLFHRAAVGSDLKQRRPLRLREVSSTTSCQNSDRTPTLADKKTRPSNARQKTICPSYQRCKVAGADQTSGSREMLQLFRRLCNKRQRHDRPLPHRSLGGDFHNRAGARERPLHDPQADGCVG